MTGTPATGTGRGDTLQGDATLTCAMSSEQIAAAFTNIQNIDRLRAHSTLAVRFECVRWMRVAGFTLARQATAFRAASLRTPSETRPTGEYRQQSAGAQLRMVGHRHRYRTVGISPLHRHVTAASSDFDEAVSGENAAHLAS